MQTYSPNIKYYMCTSQLLPGISSLEQALKKVKTSWMPENKKKCLVTVNRFNFLIAYLKVLESIL